MRLNDGVPVNVHSLAEPALLFDLFPDDRLCDPQVESRWLELVLLCDSAPTGADRARELDLLLGAAIRIVGGQNPDITEKEWQMSHSYHTLHSGDGATPGPVRMYRAVSLTFSNVGNAAALRTALSEEMAGLKITALRDSLSCLRTS